MGHSDTDQCIRGCGEVGTFFHIIWSCPRIKQYWREIIGVMSEVIDQEVTLGAKWHILCVTGEDNWPKYSKLWLMLADIVAKRNIAKVGRCTNLRVWNSGRRI